MYHIIKKFELNNGEIIGSPIGYVPDEGCTCFYEHFGIPFVDWVETNNPVDQREWFNETNTHFYLIDSKEEIPEGLTLLTDLSNIEGGQ